MVKFSFGDTHTDTQTHRHTDTHTHLNICPSRAASSQLKSKAEPELEAVLLITHLAHEVGQLVHGVGETLGLPLDCCIAAPLVTSEPERRENRSHLLSLSSSPPRSEVKLEQWITNRS